MSNSHKNFYTFIQVFSFRLFIIYSTKFSIKVETELLLEIHFMWKNKHFPFFKKKVTSIHVKTNPRKEITQICYLNMNWLFLIKQENEWFSVRNEIFSWLTLFHKNKFRMPRSSTRTQNLVSLSTSKVNFCQQKKI